MASEDRSPNQDDNPSALETDRQWVGEIRKRLMVWYREDHRQLPWRQQCDPYRILVAETMLVQTTVTAVTPHYLRFLERFPQLEDLARATEPEVVKAWEGLGYYRRARNLHKAAQRVVERYSGRIPDTQEGLLDLPGVGRYIAGAILSFAFHQPAPIVEANTQRVLTRWLNWDQPLGTTATTKRLWQAADRIVDREDPHTFNQAFMELGAVVCTPREPSCLLCPVNSLCLAHAHGRQADLPVAAKKPPTHEVLEASVIIRDNQDRLLMLKRGPHQLWADFWEFPTVHLAGVDPGGRGGRGQTGMEAREQLRTLVQSLLPRVQSSVGDRVQTKKYAVTRHKVTLQVHLGQVHPKSQDDLLCDHASVAVPHVQADWIGTESLDQATMGATTRKLFTWAIAEPRSRWNQNQHGEANP